MSARKVLVIDDQLRGPMVAVPPKAKKKSEVIFGSNRPNGGRAPASYKFSDRIGGFIRGRTRAEVVGDQIFRELKRCGWPTTKLKASEVKLRVLVRIGYLRDLDAEKVLELLRSTKLHSKTGRIIPAFANCCGHKLIVTALEKLSKEAA